MRIVQCGANRDPTALPAVLYRIHNQVLQALGKSRCIRHDVRQFWVDVALDYEAGGARQFRSVFHYRFHDLLNFYGAPIIADLPFLGGGEKQNLVDQLGNLPGLVPDHHAIPCQLFLPLHHPIRNIIGSRTDYSQGRA